MANTFSAIVGIGKFNTPISIEDWHIWVIVGLTLAFYLTLYLLRSIGLYVLAKKQRVKKAYLAWIPAVWMYVACKLAGNARFFSQPIQKFALVLCIVFSVAEALAFAYSFLLYYPLVEYAVINGHTLYIGSRAQVGSALVPYMSIDANTGVFTEQIIIPFGMSMATLSNILDALDYLSLIFDLASIFITVSVYFALFRKFWPQHYMLASLLSIFFGLFPIFVFVIRNKQPIDYNQYLRARYGAYHNPYGNPYGGYGAGYGNPYGAQGGAEKSQEPKSPFEDFEDKKNKKPEDPFEEFADKKSKNKDPFDEFDN